MCETLKMRRLQVGFKLLTLLQQQARKQANSYWWELMTIISAISFRILSRWAKHWLVAAVRFVCQTSPFIKGDEIEPKVWVSQSSSILRWKTKNRKCCSVKDWDCTLCQRTNLKIMCCSVYTEKEELEGELLWLNSKNNPVYQTYVYIHFSPDPIHLDGTFPTFSVLSEHF